MRAPGTEARVDLPAAIAPWAGDFTIEVWITPDAPPGAFDASLLMCEHYLVSGFRLGWDNSLRAQLWTSESGGSGEVQAATPFDTQRWNYLAVTKAGSSVTLYIDGTAAGSSLVNYILPNDPASIGALHGLPSSATFDELAIYGVALSEAQIANHHRVGVSP